MQRKESIYFSCDLPDDCGGALIRKGLEDELSGTGISIECSVGGGLHRESDPGSHPSRWAHLVDDPGLLGVVLLASEDPISAPFLTALVDRGVPVVFLGREPNADFQGKSFDFVGVNDFVSARRVVTHLISLGHRSIAHVTCGDDVGSVHARRLGYVSALERAGLTCREELIVRHEVDTLGRVKFSEDLLTSLLALPNPPTAVFGVHDWSALNVMLTAHLLGLMIPNDLAVAGFDGISRFQAGPPILTTAEQPFEDLGRQAALLILERQDGQRSLMQRHVLLEAPLKVLGSTVWRREDAASSMLIHDSFWRTMLVKHLIRNRAQDPLNLQNLAEAAGVSERTIIEDFARHHWVSPMKALAEERLQLVRRELQRGRHEDTVASILFGWGVSHLGRFAKAYRMRFGETPSDTLRSAQIDGHEITS